MNAMRPIHPGEVLKDELAGIGMTANAFAQALHVPANRITAILNGSRSITADTALRISRFFCHHTGVLAKSPNRLRSESCQACCWQ